MKLTGQNTNASFLSSNASTACFGNLPEHMAKIEVSEKWQEIDFVVSTHDATR